MRRGPRQPAGSVSEVSSPDGQDDAEQSQRDEEKAGDGKFDRVHG
jgi:hypothetical protein